MECNFNESVFSKEKKNTLDLQDLKKLYGKKVFSNIENNVQIKLSHLKNGKKN